jgi:hypothetical protein
MRIHWKEGRRADCPEDNRDIAAVCGTLVYPVELPSRLAFGSRDRDVGLELGYSTVTDLARLRG